MPQFQYSCFISYSHGEEELVRGFVAQFKAALKGELETLIDRKAFIDEDIHGGAFWEPKLAQALCHSVCMVLIYTPIYGQKDVCRREFEAMRDVEAWRQKLLQGGDPLGLIIPVVMRGFQRLPPPLEPRQAFDFSKFTLADVQINRHPCFAEQVRKVAERIQAHFEQMQDLEDKACEHCQGFKLPPAPPTSAWRAAAAGAGAGAGWAPAFVNR
jgi:TIR domain